jgi:hypothetical protein
MAITLSVVWFAPGTYPHDLAALVNKKEMLKSKKSPKLIFIGGSSQICLKSPLIGKELGYSVANMSLFGGLGTMEYLEEIKPYIRPGDVVVVTKEYATILSNQYYQYIHTNEEAKKAFFLMSPGRHSLEYIKNREFGNLFKTIFLLSQIKVRSYIRNLTTGNFTHLFDEGFPNYAVEYNENGDRFAPFITFRPLGGNMDFNYPEMSHLAFLNDFAEFASKRNARIVIYFSHFPEAQFRAHAKYIKAYYDLAIKSFKFPILNKPSDFMFPEKYFADTIYHLTEEGEKIRSAELIKMLKKIL